MKAKSPSFRLKIYSTSANANLRITFVTLIVTSSPTEVPGTKTTNPLTLAIPSPSLAMSSIVTSYVSPASTGAVDSLLLNNYFTSV